MAAAAGEGIAVQELHCEHKAKAEGEGRDLAVAPPSCPHQKTTPPRPPTCLLPFFFSVFQFFSEVKDESFSCLWRVHR